MTYMASQKQNQPIASHLIAQARGIPERFLLKVLKPLVSSRVLHSIKGPNGGYRLARSASDISLLDVVEAVDGPIRGQAPLAQSPGENNLDRKLEKICVQTAGLLRDHLEKIHISDLPLRA
jgi:Rrf2 family protein